MNKNNCLVSYLPSNRELTQKLKELKKVNFFLLNIDNFSNINNSYGYDVGDIVLEEVSRYLNIVKPSSSIIYRFCSDKFVLIDERELSHQEIKEICVEILSFFSQAAIEIDDLEELKISLSIGVSQAEGLISIVQAEMAVKELRKAKRNHFNIFNPSSPFIQNEQENIYWINKIKEAVMEEGIVAYFQPIINNLNGKVEKYECLARLRDDDKIISPFKFLDAARVTGNLSYVTKSLISQSYKKFSATDYEFSINITGEDLLLDYLEDILLKNSKKYNIHPSRVILEMLEDITTLDHGTTLRQLMSLRKHGFQVSIDDFGAENSNFSRLLEIEPDYLKIDGAFIKNILIDKKSQIIVEAMIMICKKSNIRMVAEYVHSEDVQNKIVELGIEYSQGYYLGEPSPNLL